MPLPNNNPNPNTNPEPEPEPFQRFFRGWLVRQEEVRRLLHQANELHRDQAREGDEARLQELIGSVLAHYAEFYEAKQRVVLEDVLILFGPPWLTPLERSLLWIAGFKPGLAFRLVTNYVTNLTDEQKQRMEQLRAETAEEERELMVELMAELTRIQTRPAVISLVEMAARGRERVNGERNMVDERIGLVKLAVEMLVECADYLRCKTALKIIDILNPYQNVKFLLAMTQLQLRVRNWGLQGGAGCRNGNRRH